MNTWFRKFPPVLYQHPLIFAGFIIYFHYKVESYLSHNTFLPTIQTTFVFLALCLTMYALGIFTGVSLSVNISKPSNQYQVQRGQQKIQPSQQQNNQRRQQPNQQQIQQQRERQRQQQLQAQQRQQQERQRQQQLQAQRQRYYVEQEDMYSDEDDETLAF